MKLTATNRAYDLDAIAVVDRMLRVLAAWHDVAVDFDGDALLLHTELEQQLGQRLSLIVVGLPIDVDRHGVQVSCWRRKQGAIIAAAA